MNNQTRPLCAIRFILGGILLLIFSLLFLSGCSNPEQRLADRLEQARVLIDEGRAADAIALLESLQSSHPGRYDVLEPLAWAYASQGAHREAALTLAAIGALDSQYEAYFFEAANQAELAGQTEEAIRHYQAFLLRNRDEPAAWQRLGSLQQSRNRYQDAVESYMEAYRIRPTPELALLIGQNFLNLGNHTQAERMLLTARAAESEVSADALISLIELAYLREDADELAQHLDALREEYPAAMTTPHMISLMERVTAFQENREALLAMLETETETETAEESVAEADTDATEPDPDPDSDTSEVAASEDTAPTDTTQDSEETTAEEVAVTEIEVDTTEPSTDIDQPTGTEEPEETTTADTTTRSIKEDLPEFSLVEEETAILPIDPEPVQETTSLLADTPADLLLDTFFGPGSEPDDGIEAPEPDATPLSKARYARQEGNLQEATDYFWESLTEEPNNVDAWLELSQTFLQMGEPASARAAALEALRRDPDNLLLIFQNLRVLQQMDTPQRLVDELLVLRERFPRSPDVALALGRAYDRLLEDRANSRFFYQEFLRLSAPEHPARTEVEDALR